MHEKSDAEALRDWESEGGAPSDLREKLKAGSLMRALTYLGSGRRALEARPKPLIQAATDAIVRVTATTICGTDLHILKGDVPTVTAGRILGHEGGRNHRRSGSKCVQLPGRGACPYFLHHLLREMHKLQKRHVLPLRERRRMDSGQCN